MLKVLRVIATMDPSSGGPCQGIRNIIPELLKLNIVNEVLCFDNPDEFDITRDSFKIHAIGPARGPYAYCKALPQWLKKNITDYDIVIIHGLWLYNSFGTYSILKKLKQSGKIIPKLYVMPHGMLDPYFQKAKRRKLKAIRNFFFWHLFENKVINNADGVLFTCREELILAKTTFNKYHPHKEINISYGIAEPVKSHEIKNDLFFREFPILKSRPYILFLSRIHPKKGTDLLIKSYLELKKSNLNLPPLVIAGPGLDSDFGILIQKLASNDCDIIFPGMLKGEDKWNAFYGCEAFILPSHQENFGIAIVEALACGKPVLISNKVNIYREIEEMNAGIVADDNEAGITHLLQTWFNLDLSERKILSENALKAFESHFTSEVAAVTFKTNLIEN